jgi:phosphoribosylaminoimidazolecarboxamide formyltransferase/IMP cyclohydrolase
VTLLDAWRSALEADPISAFGGVVALTREVDRAVAEALVSLFLEIVVAPAYSDEALRVLATKRDLRVLVDELLAEDPVADMPVAPSPVGSIRTAGGAVLITATDTRADASARWTCVTRRPPSDREQLDLDLAWRLVRGVTSNAIVLVRDGRQIGLGSGQTSRVDAARQAVEKARAILGAGSLQGAACASDAFFPFADAVEVCLAAGVTAFVQPGGSRNDAAVLAAVDRADATMLTTGVRHFRH